MTAHRRTLWLLPLLLSVGSAAAQEATPATAPPASTGEVRLAGPSAPLTLERAIELALERNVRALTAEQRVKVAEARVSQARAAFLPDLTLNGSYTRRLYEGVDPVVSAYNALGANAQARMTLFDARAFPLHAAATHEREATKLEAAEERRRVAFTAAEAFIGALTADQVLAAAQRRLEFAKTSQRDAESRFEAQLVSSNDVTKATLELATAEREAVRARGDRDAVYVTLAYVIAEPEVTSLQAPDQLLDQSRVASGVADLEQANTNRLDLQARRERVESLRSLALEPLMRLIPTLNLSAQFRLTNEPGLSGRNHDGSATVDLRWDLFDGGERYAARRERLALTRISELETLDLERQLTAEVRRAQVSVTSAQGALKQAQLAAGAAEKNAEEITILYRQGLTSALETADAGVQLFDAQVALARERFGLALAFFDLRAALGLDPLGRKAPK